MKLSIEALLDYLECPMRYYHRYIRKTDALIKVYEHGSRRSVNANSLEEHFDHEIHKIGYHIFNYIQDGRYPSEYLLRQKWGKIWCKDKTMSDLLSESYDFVQAPRHDPMKRFERQGLKAIENLHPHFKENPGTPILVGRRMDVKVGEHVVAVTLDLVRSITVEGREILELVDFKTGVKTRSKANTKPINFHIHHDLEMTVASLGFRQLIGETEDRITYYDMLNNQEYITSRGETDYQTLKWTLNHVEKALAAEIYYPIMNDRCHECPFQVQCKQGKWYEYMKQDKDE